MTAVFMGQVKPNWQSEVYSVLGHSPVVLVKEGMEEWVGVDGFHLRVFERKIKGVPRKGVRQRTGKVG